MLDTDPALGRPAADECLPYYFQYIQLVPDGHVVELLADQIAESAAFLRSFTRQQALRRKAPGEWNTLEIVGHVADVERVLGYRALRIARADPVMWTKVEFEDYAAAANYRDRPLGDVVTELATVRAASIAFLRSLDATAWQRRAPGDWTIRSVRAIAYTMAGHELHHLADIRAQHGGHLRGEESETRLRA